MIAINEEIISNDYVYIVVWFIVSITSVLFFDFLLKFFDRG